MTVLGSTATKLYKNAFVILCKNSMPIANRKMSFQKLTVDGLRKLRPLLQSQLPLSTQILNIVDLRLKGKYLKDTFQTVFYGIPGTEVINITWTPSKALEKENPAVSLIYIPSSPSSETSTPEQQQQQQNSNANAIAQAYQNIINWDKPHTFESVPAHFVPNLKKIVHEKGRFVDKIPIVLLAFSGKASTIDTQRWEDINADKFEIDNLSSEHTLKINDNWKYGNNGSEAYLAEMITFDCARGVFIKGQRSSDALVSWGMLTHLGTAGVLYTMDEVRGSGLARWTFEECLKYMADKHKLIPVCEVESENIASRNLMEKIGLKFVADLVWLNYLPQTH